MKEGRNEERKEGWIYIMRFDGEKDIQGIAKVYKQFQRTDKKSSC